MKIFTILAELLYNLPADVANASAMVDLSKRFFSILENIDLLLEMWEGKTSEA